MSPLVSSTVQRSTGGGNAACGGTICQVDEMAVGEVMTITLVGEISAGTLNNSSLANQATVFSVTPDGNLLNNRGGTTTLVTTQADLSVSKIDLLDPVAPLEQYLYEIVVTNHGPSTARNVSVSDALDPNSTFRTASAGCVGPTVGSTGTVVCTVGTLLPGQSERYLLGVQARNVASGTLITNWVTATTTTADPNPANNSDSEITTVQQDFGPQTDLSIVKAADKTTVIAGEQLTYILTVTNHGPVDAVRVEVNDALPPEVTLVQAESSAGVCAGAVCALGNLGVNGSEVVTITVQVKPGIPAGTTILNVALVSSETADLDPDNNYATLLTGVTASADLYVAKTHTGEAVAGDQMIFDLTVGNAGPSTARNVVITDTLPVGLSYANDTGSCSLVSSGPDVVRCDLGDMAAGSETTLRMTVRVARNAGGNSLTNRLTATSPTPDGFPATNNAADTVIAIDQADLQVYKTGLPNPVLAGNEVTYTLTAMNWGPSDADSVTVTDTLPLSMTYARPVAPGSCVLISSGPDVVRCDLGTLGMGSTGQVRIVARIDPDTPVTAFLADTAVAGSAAQDPNPDNNQLSFTSIVLGRADLALSKVGPDGPVTAGEQVTYTIVVTNHGPSTARDVDVKDFLPTGMTLVSSQILAGVNNPTGLCLNGLCQMGDVAAADVRTIQVVATVNTDVADGTLLRTAPRPLRIPPTPTRPTTRTVGPTPWASRPG